MAYSFQTFSIGQILTAAQMNQVEASIRDHQHGTAGVSNISTFAFTSAQLATALSDETGTGLAVFSTSPVFTTQISTPKIVGDGAGGLAIESSLGTTVHVNINNTGTVSSHGGNYLAYKFSGVLKGYLGYASSNSSDFYIDNNSGGNLLLMTGGGNVNVGGDTTPGGLFSVGSTSQFAVSSIGVVTAPKIVTASGNFEIIPVGDSMIVGDGAASANRFLVLKGGTDTAIGGGIRLDRGATSTWGVYHESVLTGAGASSTPCCIAFTGLGHKWMVNGSTTQAMSLSSAGVFGIGSTSQFAVGATGIVTAGTVPLARMMRTEVQGSAAAKIVDLDLGTVVAGDRILLTGVLSLVYTGATSHYPKWAETGAGTAVVDFAGASAMRFPDRSYSSDEETVSGVCRVTTGGTLALRFEIVGETYASGTIYGHAIVLNNG